MNLNEGKIYPNVPAFLKGKQHGKFDPHPSNSPMGISKNYSGYYDIGNNYEILAIFCHVVYATKGYMLISPYKREKRLSTLS
jgi:hypothetical protein